MTIEELLNEKETNLKILKNDLVKLGESSIYISELETSYRQLYFVTKEDVLDHVKYTGYCRDFTEHLLDIAQIKYPKNYEILKKENS